MGWLYGWDTRKELGEHLVSGNGIKTIKHCWKGNNLWAVHEWTYSDGPKAGKTVQFVALYLCRGRDRFHKRTGKYDDHGWGYKDMDESAGPNYLNCPLGYIEMVEAHEKEHGYETAGYALEWRQRVRDTYAKAARKLVAGTRIKLYGNDYTVAGKFGTGHYAVLNAYGHEFRLRKSQVKDVVLV